MKGRTVLTFVVVASLMIVGAAGSAAAHPNAGASGNCDGDQDQGDGPSVQISEDPDLTDAEEVQLTINELARFFQNKAEDPQGENACDGEDPDSEAGGDDYLEVHASGGGQGVQVCYSDGNDGSSPSQDNINQGDHYDNEYCQ